MNYLYLHHVFMFTCLLSSSYHNVPIIRTYHLPPLESGRAAHHGRDQVLAGERRLPSATVRLLASSFVTRPSLQLAAHGKKTKMPRCEMRILNKIKKKKDLDLDLKCEMTGNRLILISPAISITRVSSR